MPTLRPLTDPAIKTVLFDLDGTLADTAPDLAFALNQVLVENGRAPLPFETIRPEVSHGGIALIRLGFRIDPEHPDFDSLRQRLLKIYRDNIARETRLFPGMADLLNHIEQNNMNWGIVTNKPGWLTEPLMEALGLSQRAACIVSGDTCTNRKPQPEPILHACQLVGSEAQQCVYIGDAQRDIESGQRAGMRTIVALFGYIADDDNPEQWQADTLLETPDDIMQWLVNTNT
ncbi:MAG: phosphoglycolate phosphatase [Gammaproteobacteria bacterium]|nr:phosphoglycolate phosphatase [Gammaproteobacteria bacterium]